MRLFVSSKSSCTVLLNLLKKQVATQMINNMCVKRQPLTQVIVLLTSLSHNSINTTANHFQ